MAVDDAQKTILFEKTPIPRAVAKLALPTVLSSLVMVLYSLADTWFVGMTNDPVQNAAVTLAAPVLLAFNAVNNLFGVGTSSMMGRALGRKDFDTVKRCSAFGIWASVVSGLFFSALFTLFKQPFLSILGAEPENMAATSSYLYWTVTLGAAPSILNVVMAYLVRTEGASMHASIGTMSGCAINIVLDPVFILYFKMGAAGAGLATFLSNCLACLYFICLLAAKRGKSYVCIDPRMAKPKKEIVSGICAVGIPASIQNLLNVTGMTVLNNFTSAFGSDAVAAMGIAYKINMVPMQVAFGLTQGIMPLVSYNYGSRDYARAKKSVLFTGKAAVLFLVGIAALFYVFAQGLMGLFISNTAIIRYGKRFLRGMSLSLPFLCVDFLGVMTYQACGKGMFSLVFAFLRKIVLEIPALFLLNAWFPLYGLAYAQFAAEAILSFAAVVVLTWMFQNMGEGAQKQEMK